MVLPQPSKLMTRVRFSYPAPKTVCPGGEIGRHAGLRSQCFGVTVRVRPRAPKF